MAAPAAGLIDALVAVDRNGWTAAVTGMPYTPLDRAARLALA
ncbi:hypothetical protein SFUMM280S_02446 [Streptomyces fumanus]